VADVDLSQAMVDALRLALWLTAPALAACVVAAFFSSLVQASTQTHDPSVGFVPKWLIVLFALFLSRTFLADGLLSFSSRVLREMAQLGR
jgi:flagellar biosynthesis protein FliQ